MPLESYLARAIPHGPIRISATMAARHGKPDKRLAIQRGIVPSEVARADLSGTRFSVEALSATHPSLTETRGRPI
jgi:hypothetical protein